MVHAYLFLHLNEMFKLIGSRNSTGASQRRPPSNEVQCAVAAHLTQKGILALLMLLPLCLLVLISASPVVVARGLRHQGKEGNG